jgi:uridine kinase
MYPKRINSISKFNSISRLMSVASLVCVASIALLGSDESRDFNLNFLNWSHSHHAHAVHAVTIQARDRDTQDEPDRKTYKPDDVNDSDGVGKIWKQELQADTVTDDVKTGVLNSKQHDAADDGLDLKNDDVQKIRKSSQHTFGSSENGNENGNALPTSLTLMTMPTSLTVVNKSGSDSDDNAKESLEKQNVHIDKKVDVHEKVDSEKVDIVINEQLDTKQQADNKPSHKKTPFIVGISGSSGSGKTSLVEILKHHFKAEHEVSSLKIAFISADAYYRSLDTEEEQERAAKQEFDFDHPDALDLERLAEDLERLKQGNVSKRGDVTVSEKGNVSEEGKVQGDNGGHSGGSSSSTRHNATASITTPKFCFKRLIRVSDDAEEVEEAAGSTCGGDVVEANVDVIVVEGKDSIRILVIANGLMTMFSNMVGNPLVLSF